MQVERVDFVDVPTRDVARAIAFYRDVLELPQNPREPTEFETPNVTLALWEPAKQGVEFRAAPRTGSRSGSLTSRPARAELEAKGIEFDRHARLGRLPHGASSRIPTATR